MSMEQNLKEILDEILNEVEQELEEATTTGDVAGYNTPNAFSDKGKSDKKKKKKIATSLGYSVVDGDVDNISEAIKGRNNKTGESFGMVIGSDKQGNNGYELTVRKTYNSRISAYGFIFDKDSNLTDIRDYGYSLDGKFPDMKGHASSTSVRPNKRETITQIAKITSPAFAKKIYQHVQKNNKMDESVNEAIGMSQSDRNKIYHKLNKGDKVRIKFGNAIRKRNEGEFIVSKGKTKVGKQRVERITLKNVKNPSGVKYYLYNRNNNIGMAQGDMGAVIEDMEIVKESVNEISAKKGLEQVIKGNTKDVEGIKVSKEMAQAMLDWFNSSPYGRKYPKAKNSRLHISIGIMLSFGLERYAKHKGAKEELKYLKSMKESVNESKVKRPVNRWLELKNDETMHAHKKMAMGLKELKYQLRETEKFFNWYNKIKTMNELDSNQYWKRTNKHIYSIKEKLINIAKTIQEIEK